MDTISYSKLRANLKYALDKVSDDHEVIVVERPKSSDVVLVARDDYDSLAETAYLLRSPANAKRLIEAARRPARLRKTYSSAKALKDEVGL